jgi:hypothetical protein
MDATPTEARDARLELAEELLLRTAASAALARDPDGALPPATPADGVELVLACERARAHLARRRGELPPLHDQLR